QTPGRAAATGNTVRAEARSRACAAACIAARAHGAIGCGIRFDGSPCAEAGHRVVAGDSLAASAAGQRHAVLARRAALIGATYATCQVREVTLESGRCPS